MEQPKILFSKPAGEVFGDAETPTAVNRLRHKAKELKGPRGKYRCRKCHDLPCTCADPKQSTPGPVKREEAASAPPVALFTEKNSKRLLEAGFGIPTVLTNCKLWALTEEEALELSKPAADVLNEFVSVDPKWVSLSILTVSMGSIMARKAVLYSAWKRATQIQQANQRPAGRPAETEPAAAAPTGEGSPESNGTSDKNPGPSASIDMLQ